MKTLGTEFKVGVFTLFATFVIGYMFIFLVPDLLDNKEYNQFYTVVDNAAGIVPKTHVRTNGVTVGKVAILRLEASTTRIELEVEQGVQIPAGSTVEIRTRGLLGETFIEIVRAPDTGAFLKPGEKIPMNSDQVGMQELIGLVGDIAKDIKNVTRSFANVLGTQQGETSIANIVENIERFTKEIKELIAENRAEVKSMIANLEDTSQTLKNVIGSNEAELNDIILNVRATSEDLKEFGKNIREIVSGENREKIDRIIAQFDNTMEDVEVTAKNIRLVSDKLEKGEGTLGKLINNDEALTELEGAIKDIREVLSPAKKLKVGVDYHGEVRADDTTQHYFNVVFQTRPDKYFLVGFTDVSEKEINTITPANPTRTDDDGRTIETKYVEERNALRFNVQFAKRWHDLVARFGLFESTGGIAADYYILDDKIRVTLEAYDWDSESLVRQTARIRAYVNVLFFNHVYAVVGMDDFLRYKEGTTQVDDSKNTFFGAGLTFNDQDLKALFGTAAVALQ